MPMGGDYLWRAFQRLSSRRSTNGFGVNALSWPDIDAFVRLSGAALEPWEIEVIEHLDGLYLAQQAKQQAKTK